MLCWFKRSLFILSLCFFALWSVYSNAAHAQSKGHFLGNLSCSSTTCHGHREASHHPQRLPLDEFSRWTRSDPHAQAARILDGKRFAEILTRLGALRDNQVDQSMYDKCAGCHDPLGLAARRQSADVGRGIGCESCHGPGENWLAKHFERDTNPQLLQTLGMTNTKNLVVRGQVCAACHIGSKANDLNHDMLAAGHPELLFELTTYHAQLPKHWSNSRERIATRDFESQLWSVGQYTGALAALELRSTRAAQAAETSAQGGDQVVAWPEFAEFSCYACHKPQRIFSGDLTASFDRQVKKGPLTSSEWSFALLENNLAARNQVKGLSVFGNSGGGSKDFSQLRFVFADAPSDTARQARASIAELKSSDTIHSFQAPALEKMNARLLLALVRNSISAEMSWEKSCQLALALAAVERTFLDEVQILQIKKLITAAESQSRFAEIVTDQELLLELRTALAYVAGTRLPRTLRIGASEPSKTKWVAGNRGSITSNDVPVVLAHLTERWDRRHELLKKRFPLD